MHITAGTDICLGQKNLKMAATVKTLKLMTRTNSMLMLGNLAPRLYNLSSFSNSKYSAMIGCLRTRFHKQPIITLNFEFDTVLEIYNLGARAFLLSLGYDQV